MDIREVQTNITTSKSGFETSPFLQRGQPLRSHVWCWHDDFQLLCHLKFQIEIQHFWSLLHSATGAGAVTSQIFNLECYTLGHHCISYFIAFWLDPRNSTQLKDPRRELGISLFSYLSFLEFWKEDRLILIIFSLNISFIKIKERG